MARKITLELIVALLVLLFLYAGVSKLLDYKLFQEQLSKSPWIQEYNSFLAAFLPAFEILISLMLIWGGRMRLIALMLYAASLTVFAVYISLVLLSGLQVPCSCGGLIQKLHWPQHIVLNLVFSTLAIIAIYLERYKSPPENTTTKMALLSKN